MSVYKGRERVGVTIVYKDTKDTDTLKGVIEGTSTSLDIPNGVEKINQYLCYQNASLTKLTIPNTVKEIGLNAFAYTKITELVLPDNVETIQANAFADITTLTTVHIPKSLKTMGDNIFRYCSSLINVTFEEGFSEIGYRMFANTKLSNIQLPDSLVSISGEGFYRCPFVNITLPNNLQTLNTRAFGTCEQLTEITIPDSVTSLGSSVFTGCTRLTKAFIGKNVDSFKSTLFGSCSRLVEIVFSAELTRVVPLDTTNALSGINANCKIYVPDSLYDTWKTTTNWTTYADKIYKLSERPVE